MLTEEMEAPGAAAQRTVTAADYKLTEDNSQRAIERGLAEADWYQCPVSKADMRALLERRDGPAIVHTTLWLALLLGSGYWAYLWWGGLGAILPFAIYGVLYASVSDSRWHEAGHGTAFKTDWLNTVVYELASFMVMRESTIWRWSHTRHHSDTIIVGRDPEIAVPRPPDVVGIFLAFFNIRVYPAYFKSILIHSVGKMSTAEKLFVPEAAHGAVFLKARIYVLIYATTIGLAVHFGSLLPLMFVGLTNLYGSWLMVVYGLTQHAGLAENVLDHRLNCRTVYMNPLNRFLYWNMNYHVEHHMFPLVPYHQLPRLHQLVKSDMPEPYTGLIDSYREIIPAIRRQVSDPGFHVRRKLPEPAATEGQGGDAIVGDGREVVDGWIEVCDAGMLEKEDVVRFDHGQRTYAVYRTLDNSYYATDGICTHGNTHLADGLVKGKLIECPKHNGRFNLEDGSPARPPVCVGLRTYQTKNESDKLYLKLEAKGGAAEGQKTHRFKVVSNELVATFIRELVLEPYEPFEYRPGQYLQLDIPTYDALKFADFQVGEPYADVWRTHHVFDHQAANAMPCRRNYSFASNPEREQQLRFNVRIATPPRGQDCSAGVGSTFVHSLRPGDPVTAIGPFGDFLIKDSDKEMVYIGGGAGMAPMRSHLSYLFESSQTTRKVSYWYGARAEQDIFYDDYFEGLAASHPNFSFHLGLSEPLSAWDGLQGYIHEIVRDEYLRSHPDLAKVEFYLCGPPAMIAATRDMLTEEFQVREEQIAFDEF